MAKYICVRKQLEVSKNWNNVRAQQWSELIELTTVAECDKHTRKNSTTSRPSLAVRKFAVSGSEDMLQRVGASTYMSSSGRLRRKKIIIKETLSGKIIRLFRAKQQPQLSE